MQLKETVTAPVASDVASLQTASPSPVSPSTPSSSPHPQPTLPMDNMTKHTTTASVYLGHFFIIGQPGFATECLQVNPSNPVHTHSIEYDGAKQVDLQ